VLLLALAALVPLFALGFGYATLREPYRPVFRRHRVRVPISWPGLSVLHISDLHVRRSDLRLYRAQKAALAGLTPDLLCVTGDVCEEVEDIDLVIDLLRTVKPRLGTFIVLGNHEHNAPCPPGLADAHRRGWRRALGNVLSLFTTTQRSDGDEEGHAMAGALQAAGLTVLHNEGARP
jgi:predicted MPP superfamily phosphohydrolase